jgi:hypothetical protein
MDVVGGNYHLLAIVGVAVYGNYWLFAGHMNRLADGIVNF